MDADRELAEIYARQAVRAGRAGVVVGVGGAGGTLVLAFLLSSGAPVGTKPGVFLAILGFGLAITAVL